MRGTRGAWVLLLGQVIPIWCVVGLALSASAFAAHAQPASAAEAGASGSEFRETPCMVELPYGEVDGTTVTCGYMTVPERHMEPDGPTIELAVVVLRAISLGALRAPVVWAQGGPGGSTLEDLLSTAAGSPLRVEHDMVLFDQRGTGHSKPSLDCPEIEQYEIEHLPVDLPDEEASRGYQEAAIACRDRLKAQGINLEAFNTLENAADVEPLVRALGYQQFHFYGVSYGSELALNVVRLRPGGLSSVILDGVVPADLSTDLEYPQSMDRAFTEFFNACAEDPECGTAYPDLEGFFFGLVDRLEKDPVTIRLVDSANHKGYDALFDGEWLIGFLFESLYMGDLVPYLPMVLHDIAEGNYAVLESLESMDLFEQEFYEGMHYSVDCSDNGNADGVELSTEGIRPPIAKDVAGEGEAWAELCRAWGVPDLGKWLDRPVSSDIPVLLMSGRFDPITPAAYAERAARTLSNTTQLVFTNVGHGAVDSSACANSIMLDFVDDLEYFPDTSCAEAIAGPDFLTPEEIARLPVTDTFLRVQEGDRQVTIALIAIGVCMALILLPCSVVDWEIRWWHGAIRWRRRLFRVLRRGSRFVSGRRSWISRLAVLWAIGIAVLGVGYLVYYRHITVQWSVNPYLPWEQVAPGFAILVNAIVALAPSLILMLAVSVLEDLRARRPTQERTACSLVLVFGGVGLLIMVGPMPGFWTVVPWIVPAGVLFGLNAWRFRAKTGRILERWSKAGGSEGGRAGRLLRLSGVLLSVSTWVQVVFALVFLSLMALIVVEDESQVLLLTFGIPSWAKWVMYPFWLVAGSAILQAGCTAAVLRERGWSIWRKLLYVLGSLVGLTLVGFLAIAGALAPIF